MPQDSFLSPPGDAEEPDGSPLPRVAGDGPDDEEHPAEQGLYVCLPAGQVTLEGFAQGGQADTMAPGPLLATIVNTVTGENGAGLAGCSDDQLMGIMSAARRMEARAAWTLLAAVREFAARHDGSRPGDEFAPDEVAFQLHLSPLSAAEQMHYAAAVARRLPQTFALLGAGQIHPVHLRIIEDETGILSDEDAARADEILSRQTPGLTFGEMRAAAHKLIFKLDPEAVRKRKEAARRDAHVRRFREPSGNAGMVARELPSDEVLASWQHVEQRALDRAPPGCPAPCGSCVSAPTSTYCRSATAATSPPGPSPPAAEPRPAPQTGPRRTATHPAMPTQTTPGPGETAPAAPVPAPLPVQAPLPGRAWPRWSPSRSPGPPAKATPTPPAKLGPSQRCQEFLHRCRAGDGLAGIG